MKPLSDMNAEELEKLLAELKENLAEVEEERSFVMGQTGYHLPGRTVKKYEAEVDGLRARIEEIDAVLRAKRAEQ